MYQSTPAQSNCDAHSLGGSMAELLFAFQVRATLDLLLSEVPSPEGDRRQFDDRYLPAGEYAMRLLFTSEQESSDTVPREAYLDIKSDTEADSPEALVFFLRLREGGKKNTRWLYNSELETDIWLEQYTLTEYKDVDGVRTPFPKRDTFPGAVAQAIFDFLLEGKLPDDKKLREDLDPGWFVSDTPSPAAPSA